MSGIKFLACSDFITYDKFSEIFDRSKPNAVLLAGDLTSDGLAEFWDKAVELIPDFQREEKQLRERFGVVKRDSWYTVKEGGSLHAFLDQLHSLIEKYRKAPEFNEIRKAIHVEEFYKSLKHASSNSKVFCVKGDHDEDFEGDYDIERIDRIKNCHEISGQLATFHGIRILGLGYRETHYLRTLRPLIEKMKGKVDIVLTHAEQRRLPLISGIKPKLIVRGHFELGKYRVYGVPVVSTLFPRCYALIEMQNHELKRVSCMFYCDKSKTWENCNFSCKLRRLRNETRKRVRIKEQKQWPWLDRIIEECPIETWKAKQSLESLGESKAFKLNSR